MDIPRAALKAYNDAIKAQGGAANDASRKLVDAFMAQNPGADVAEIRDFAAYVLESAVSLYGNASAQAAIEFRNELVDASGTKLPDVSYDVVADTESITKTVHYQAGKLADGAPTAFSQAIGNAAQYYCERQANNAMIHAAGTDAMRTGNVRYARIPMGAETCGFCMMLASRGFVYHSAKWAGECDHYHWKCDCRVIPGYGDDPSAEGYDPKDYLGRYSDFIEEHGGSTAWNAKQLEGKRRSKSP